VALRDADPHALWDCLDETARPLFGLARAPLHQQAEEIAEAITNRLGLRATTDSHGHLLLNHALADRVAHPILLATIGHELARHAGLCSVVAAAARTTGPCSRAKTRFCRSDTGAAPR
jgi:hypothetical protein